MADSQEEEEDQGEAIQGEEAAQVEEVADTADQINGTTQGTTNVIVHGGGRRSSDKGYRNSYGGRSRW